MFRHLVRTTTLVVALAVAATVPVHAQDQKGTLVFAVESLGAQTLDPILEGRPGNAVYQAVMCDSLVGFDLAKGGVGPENWKDAMTALGFWHRLTAAGFENLGIIIDNDAKRIELLALLDTLFATGTRDDWVAKLRGADIVSAPINTLLEASNDPDVVANGYVTHVDHPKHGKLKVHGTPWQFSETPAKPGIAPELGEHNAAVLGGLGYSVTDVADLKARKII